MKMKALSLLALFLLVGCSSGSAVNIETAESAVRGLLPKEVKGFVVKDYTNLLLQRSRTTADFTLACLQLEKLLQNNTCESINTGAVQDRIKPEYRGLTSVELSELAAKLIDEGKPLDAIYAKEDKDTEHTIDDFKEAEPATKDGYRMCDTASLSLHEYCRLLMKYPKWERLLDYARYQENTKKPVGLKEFYNNPDKFKQ
jgi:hypothetical protein